MLFVYLLIHVVVFVSLTATVHVALFVCLTLFASFFLPSHLSLKHVNAVKVHVQYNVHVVCCMYMYEPLFSVHTKLTLGQSSNFIVAKKKFAIFRIDTCMCTVRNYCTYMYNVHNYTCNFLNASLAEQ